MGQKWHTFHNLHNKDMGIRPIKRIQSNAITFATEKGESYLWYPKAKDFKFPDDRTVQVYENEVLMLTYKLVDDL